MRRTYEEKFDQIRADNDEGLKKIQQKRDQGGYRLCKAIDHLEEVCGIREH